MLKIGECKEYGITDTIEGSIDLTLVLTQMADGWDTEPEAAPSAIK